jgi:hypothetical protein
MKPTGSDFVCEIYSTIGMRSDCLRNPLPIASCKIFQQLQKQRHLMVDVQGKK